MIAILYNENGYFIGTNAYLTEGDDIQLPHFFVEEVPTELLNIPEGHRAKIDPATKAVSYEKLPDVPEVPPSAQERLTALEAENKLLKVQNQALSNRADFMEDVMSEVILTLFP